MALDTIRAAFAAYFSGALVLPDGTLAERGEISKARWHVRYVLVEVDGQRCLDFYATNRFTNDRHVRIHEDGRVEILDALRDGYGYDPKLPGDRERAEREYFAYNQRVAQLLRAKGLC